MKTLMRDPRAGVMHSLIYYGFIVLFLGTVTLEIDHLLPGNLKFLHGQVYQGYSAILDLASLAYLGGLALAIVNRYLVPPDRLRTKTKPEDALILGLLVILLALSGLLTEAARISLAGRPDFEVWSFVGYPLSALIPESGAADLHRVFWIGHVLGFVGFLVILPVTKLRHMLTSPANLFLSAHPRPKGAMRAMPNLLEADDIDTHRGLVGLRSHLEADLRHRCLHHLWAMHLGLPGQHHRQAPRSERDRPQDRRGGCRGRRSQPAAVVGHDVGG